MATDEFSLIEEFFGQPSVSRSNENTLLSIGDDAAVVQVPQHHLMVQTIDTLVAGRHFPEQTDARLIAYKSLAVNVSDLAAMAASPAFFLLSLTLPEVNEDFLKGFSEGLFEAVDEFGIELIGGDTCRGPMSISIQASGFVPKDQYVTRSGARPGDHIFVSGQLGSAALGLAALQGQISLPEKIREHCLQALNKPQPRVDMIPLLRQFASAAIDVSDGLVGDLQHILKQSGVGALVQESNLPVVDFIRENELYPLALSGGDDYQLLFTVGERELTGFLAQVNDYSLDATEVGVIKESGYHLQSVTEGKVDLSRRRGFDHFVKS